MKSYIRLSDSIASKEKTRFMYGTHDCCMFSLESAQDMLNKKRFWENTGLPKYRGEVEAMELINKFGSLEALVNHVCFINDFNPVDREPKWGDIVMFVQDNKPTVGIMTFQGICTSSEGKGVCFFPCENVYKVWSFS